MSHVFISYSTQNRSYASQLADKLRLEGFNVWIDNIRLRSSEDWWRSIVLAIDTCAAFVVILTPDSDQSKWVQREITLADQRNKPIFPLLLAGSIDTPNWALFVRTQYADMRIRQLPDAAFYDQLAHHAPRQQHKGQDITDPRMPRPTLTIDPVLQAAISDPPPPDVQPRRRLVAPLVGILALLAVIVLLVSIMPPPEPAPNLNAEQHLLLGMQAADNGDYDTAVEEYTQALEMGYPNVAQVLTLRGNSYHSHDNAVAALGDYDAALREDPTYFEAYIGRGQIFSNRGEYPLAVENFEAALEHVPAGSAEYDVRQQLAWAYHDVGDYDRAIDQFGQALDIARDASQHADAHFGLGLTFLIMREYPQAIDHLEQATEAHHDFPDAYDALGEAYIATDNPEAALAAYRTFVDLLGGEVEASVLTRIQELEQMTNTE